MRLCFVIIFCWPSVINCVFGKPLTETDKINSLNSIINQNIKDTNHVKALIDLSEILYISDLDTVLVLNKKAAKICLLKLKEELTANQKVSFKKSLSGAYNNIGFIYDDKGDVVNALDFYHKSLKIREQLNDKEGIAVSLNNIGVIYIKQGDPKQALMYYHKSLQVKQELGDKKSISTSLNNLAGVYQQLGDFKKSLEYYTKSLIIREELKDEKGIAVTLNNMGTLYKNDQGIDTALHYYEKALKLREKIGDKRGMTNTLSNIGGILILKKDFISAEKYGLRAFKIADELGYLERKKDASFLLADAYEGQQNWKKAFEMKSLFLVLKDSIKNNNTELELFRQKSKYELEKVTKEKEILAQEIAIKSLLNTKNKTVAIAFILAFVLALAIILFIYRENKKKDYINNLLKKQKEDALQQNEDKIALLKEIHHRVKNSLQVVSSLIRLQSNEVDDEKITKMFNETQNRVLSIAKLHEQLYSSENLKEIDIEKHFMPLINDLVDEYQIGTKISLDVQLEKTKMGAETLVPLGLIINEMISNSLKYGFTNKDEGTITIHISHLEKDTYEMIIGDNGVGMPKDFNFHETNSLGTQLILIFTEQLNGTISRINKEGTYFKILFEKQKG